ncbi:P-loop containing nucleoside triphosphate hydrolase protein [Cristinia sonorae]|uniref:Origin recognition complex subunit 1 n=1 Tax=Cristinia sonorae TaxID=1940300 RepID=A0A8K0XM63_9AGAR|nr:P-loop containing nucleoside triphosphate hydrolase protein [Cristinia sonorae]
MAVDKTPLTPRRSKRGQPIARVAASAKQVVSIIPSPVVHTRPTVVDDLLSEEIEEINEEDVGLDALKTRFHESFTVQRNVASPIQSRRKPKKPVKNDAQDSEDGGPSAESASVDNGDVFKVGDTIRVQSSGREASVAVIVAVWTINGGDLEPIVHLRIHWFVRPSELPAIRAKRTYYQNEVYFSLDSSAVISVSSVIDRCEVYSISDESAPSTSSLVEVLYALEFEDSPFPPQRTYCCRLAVHPVRGLYYAFSWKDHRQQALEASSEWGLAEPWIVVPEPVREPPLKKRRLQPIRERKEDSEDGGSDLAEMSEDEYQEVEEALAESSESEGQDVSDDEPSVPRTPSRKRKRAPSTPRTPRTPSRKRTTKAAPTPHSKAALRARANRKRMAIRPPPPDRSTDISLQLENLPKDPWYRAMHVLHVASRPDALPCREEEYGKVLRSVEELIEEGSGGCVYISGVPGTGKTATVHAVVRELKRMAEQNEGNPFTYVEINGLRIPEPSAAYGLLWEAVSGHNVSQEGHLKISSKEALKQLSRHFSSGRAGPSGHACVVLMDELDQLMTTKQDVVYNFFNWPTLVGSRLVVLAVANTMDLPERVMTGRVRSRLGMTRINFQPYTTPQLEKIVKARLASAKEGLPEETPDVIAPDGIKFASMKVSSISGDARRVLDICRRTVELVQPRAKTAGTEDVKQVIKDMQNSPTAAYLRDLSFHERLMLAAMLKCIKKEGVEEIRWGDLQHQHLVYVNILAGDEDSFRKPTSGELSLVLEALVASRAMLCEEGAVVLKKGEDERRVVLNLEHGEVERVLGEVGGVKWRNALNI